MRRSYFVIVLIALLVSACSGRAEPAPTTQPSTLAEQPQAAANPAPAAVEAPAATVVTATTPTARTTPLPLPPSGDWRILPKTLKDIQQVYEIKLAPLGMVRDMAWAPDGKTLAVIGKSGLVLLDGETLAVKRELAGGSQHISLAFNADGSRLAASGLGTNTIHIWDTASGELLRAIVDAGYDPYFAPDGKTLAVVEERYEPNAANPPVETIIKLFDVQSGKLIRTLTAKTPFPVWTQDMPYTTGVFFSRDGSKLQAVNLLGDVRQWDVASGALLNTSLNSYTRERLSNGLCATDRSRGDAFAVACFIVYMDPPCVEETPGCNPVAKQRYEIGFWDTNQFKRLKNTVINDSAGLFRNMVFDPQSRTVGLLDIGQITFMQLQGAAPQERTMINAGTAAWTSNLESCPNCPSPLLAFKPGSAGSQMAVAFGGTVELWNVTSETKLKSFENDTRQVSSAALGVSQDYPLLALGLSDGSLSLISPGDGAVIHELSRAHENAVQHLAFSSGGDLLLSAGSDQALKGWSAQQLESVREYPFEPVYGAFAPIYRFAAGAQNGLLAASQRDPDKNTRFLVVQDVKSGEERYRIQTDAGHAAFSLNGNWMVTGKNSVALRYMDTGELLREFYPSEGADLVDIAINADGSLVAAAQDKVFMVWNVNTSEMYPFTLPDSLALSLTFSPTGCLLAMGDRTGQLYLMDLASHQVTAHWQAHSGGITTLQFSDDGRLLLSVGQDGSARVWGQPGVLSLPAGETPFDTCQFGAPPLTSTPATPTLTFTPSPPTATPTLVPYARSLYLMEPVMVGSDVRQLQERLLALGYSQVGIPDGVFGKKTDQAVRKFQEVNQLVVDGVVGPLTWQALFGEDAAPANP